jgi:hypothetical protein
MGFASSSKDRRPGVLAAAPRSNRDQIKHALTDE